MPKYTKPRKATRKKCQDCGIPFYAQSSNAKYCVECKDKRL